MDTVTPDLAPALTGRSLNTTDRCDSCGSQAFVRATLPSGSELLFCGHHANAHRPSLLVSGASLHDETDKLTVRRGSDFGVER